MHLYSRSGLTKKMKVLFRFSAVVLFLEAVVLLHGRATAPGAEAETLKSTPLEGLASGNSDIDKLILDAGVKHGIDPKLIYYVIRQESRFKPQATSDRKSTRLNSSHTDISRMPS